MKSHIIRHYEEEITPTPVMESTSLNIPFSDKWKKWDVQAYYFDQQYCLIREVIYPLDFQHGKYSFQHLNRVVEKWNDWDGVHPLSAKGLNVNELFFFDTETTGLGGGVGNTIFLLGHARVFENKVILRQHILPEPGNEIALYQSFLERVDYRTLVTYNGKSFDWPQLKTRHTLIRDHVPKLPAFGHFDLYHAARRLWKHKLESVKLANVEKDILQVGRKEDIPGYLAPMIYFDYVERKDPEGMFGILKHNEIDILSLISLYIHLSYQVLQLDTTQTSEEKLQVAKWFQYIGEYWKERIILEKMIGAKDKEKEVDRRAKFALAQNYKRNREYNKAVPLWHEMVGSEPNDEIHLDSCIELSKYYEHKEKNYPEALKFATKVLNSLEKKQDGHYQEIMKRVERLHVKIGKYE